MIYRLISLEGFNARKNHRCNYCGEIISIGDWYLREKSVYGGDFHSVAWHPECNRTHGANGEFEYEPMQMERPQI